MSVYHSMTRPPTVRTTRNPRRRPPHILNFGEANRPLLRQVIRSRRSNPVREAYVLEVREGPVVNSNANAATASMIPQPWVTVRDYYKGNDFVSLPVSICNTLLKHLMTCATVGDHQAESSEDSEIECTSSPSPKVGEEASLTETSGETVSQVEGGAKVTKKVSSGVKPHTFQLSLLKPIRIVCEATGCTLEVTARNPLPKHTSTNSEEPTQTVQADPDKRWLISAPLEVRKNNSSNGEQTLDSSGIGSTTNGSGRRQFSWETRGTLELHASLMPQLLTFLADVVTRYRAIDLIPKVQSLYSISGERRFLFNLKDTRWGKRIHISQVTDLHRNVIGIPLEDLVSFRSRLDTVIKSLGLEDQYAIRSSIHGNTENRSTHKEQRTTVSSQDTSNVSGGVNGIEIDEENNLIDTSNTKNRTHGREVRPSRTGVSTLNNKESRNVGIYDGESGQRRNHGSRFGRRSNWTNGGRGHPVKRKDKNQLSSNRDLKTSDETKHNEVNTNSNLQNSLEPAVESTRITPAAEASA
ncbi:hypothetical protein Smp_044680 [Schistosoma mansoni]|uniref:hypothetical protein n=1 Tax=Schistosoma mansoni TaxID=6183 RepID=UPI00022C8574|nr:hypothetical protein Smp_044680 [Schistosoma mansoni]|eukprot:XP_018646189.1 hypothetical protein Smp_044680 [Schistosoma mansoni]